MIFHNYITRLIGICVLVALCSCGGGGGGSTPTNTAADTSSTGNTGTVTQPSGPSNLLLSFTPSTATANVVSGNSAAITVRATINDPSRLHAQVYAYVVQDSPMLSANVDLSPIDHTSVSATVHTLTSLASGHYQGTWLIKLCNDYACSSQVGAPVPLPYDITVADPPLGAYESGATAATVHRGGVITDIGWVTVTGPTKDWSASSSAGWLKISNGSGHGPGLFTVTYDPQGLIEGDFAATVTVQSVDGEVVTLPFALKVQPTEFILQSGLPSFSAINGASILPQTLSFVINNGMSPSWTATSSASWLSVVQNNSTSTPSITLQVDPGVATLGSGNYIADLTLSSEGVLTRVVEAQLALTKATLTASPMSITLGGSRGRDLSVVQSTSLSLNTDNSWPYMLSALPSWLTATATTGSVNSTGTPLTFGLKPENLAIGSSSAVLTVSSKVNGDTVTTPLFVAVNVDQRRLLASEWGVGLSSSPVGTTLTRTLTIRDNFAGNLNWTATSDSTWLTVTSSGDTSGSATLTLSADPSSLPLDTVSYANVTVSTSTNGVSPAVIRVALWRSAMGPSGMTRLALRYTNLTADTIRPYVYADNNGTSIDIFNAYTGAKVGALQSEGASFGAMSVSADGNKLYAVDTALRMISVFDLNTLQKLTTWALDPSLAPPLAILAIRTNGVDIVMGPTGTYVNGRNVVGQSAAIYDPNAVLVGSIDGRRLFSADSLTEIDYSEMSGGMFLHDGFKLVSTNTSSPVDWAVNHDGTRLYSAGIAGVFSSAQEMIGSGCGYADTVSGNFIDFLPTDLGTNNVEVTRDDRVVCGVHRLLNDGSDFSVFSSDGTLMQSYVVSDRNGYIPNRRLVVTPDGFVVIALTTNPYIAFVPIAH